MSETMRFRIARGPQRARPPRASTLRLFGDDLDPAQLFARPDTEPGEPAEPDDDYPGQAVVAAATAWTEDGAYFVDPVRARTPHVPGDPTTPRPYAAVIDLVRRLDAWLTADPAHHCPTRLTRTAAALAAALPDADRADDCSDDHTDDARVLRRLTADPRWTAGWGAMARSFCAMLAADLTDSEEASRSAARLQRLLLVAALVETLAAAEPLSTEDVRGLLRDRVVVVPSPPFPIVDVEPAAARRRRRILRRAGFDDLWVVREEWVCYRPGEIAHIENVLEGERRQRIHRRIDETETTDTTEVETVRSEQRDTQTTDRNETTDEASRDTALQIQVDAQVDTSGQYGPTKVETTWAAASTGRWRSPAGTRCR